MAAKNYSRIRRGVLVVAGGAGWTAIASDDCTDQQTEAALAAGGVLIAFEAVNASVGGSNASYKLNADNLADAGDAASPILSSVSAPDLDFGAPILSFAVEPAADGALTVTALWGYV